MVFGQNVVEVIIRAKDEFSRAFKNAKLSMAGFQKSAVAVGAVGAGIAVGMSKAVSAGIELETAMVGVAKTTGLADREIENLRQQFIGLSQEMPISATELASIGEVAGQLGITGADNIRGFTETVSKMSIATELTAEDSALALAKISNAMGLPISESEKLGSAINELSNISAASSSEIVNALVRVSGSAQTLGLSTDVVSGLTASLIAAGEPAERAGTKLRSAFDQVVKNIEGVEEVLPGFADKMRKDANGAILELIDTVSKIEDPLERQKTAIDIFGTVGASAINKLSNNIPEMNRLIEASAGQFENATSLQQEYEKASESTANQIQLVKNQFMALGFELADALIPIIRDTLLPAAKLAVELFKNLPGPVKQAIVVLGLVTVAIATLSVAVGVLTAVASPWLLIIGAIILVITALILIVRQLWKSWDTMSNKMKMVTLLFFPLIGAGIMLIKNWDKIKEKLYTLGQVFKNIFIGIRNIVVGVWNYIMENTERGVNFMIDMLNSLTKFWSKIPVIGKLFKGKELGNIDLSGIKGELKEFESLKMPEKSDKKIEVNIDKVQGVDAKDISDSMQRSLTNVIRLN